MMMRPCVITELIGGGECFLDAGYGGHGGKGADGGKAVRAVHAGLERYAQGAGIQLGDGGGVQRADGGKLGVEVGHGLFAGDGAGERGADVCEDGIAGVEEGAPGCGMASSSRGRQK